ncbi:hypothetical protein Tco_1393607 [Tanacetum coccineum]
MNRTTEIKIKLKDIDKLLDQLGANDDPSFCSLRSFLKTVSRYPRPWKRKTRNLADKGVMIDGEWSGELEAPISRDEIRRAVWDCGENKSPGPDGFTFEFFRKFPEYHFPDICLAFLSVNGSSGNMTGIMHTLVVSLYYPVISINLKKAISLCCIPEISGFRADTFDWLFRFFKRRLNTGISFSRISDLLEYKWSFNHGGSSVSGTLMMGQAIPSMLIFNQVQNKCWKECFTLPGGVSGHIETISSSLIQIFEKMVFLKT